MTDQEEDPKRDEVLFAFHQAFKNPSSADIEEWTKRHPTYAEDIRAHAAFMKDWAATDDRALRPPSPELMSRSQSRAMNALHKARQLAAANGDREPITFQQIMTRTGRDIPTLETELGITRGILSALVRGQMRDVGEPLVLALTAIWCIPRSVFDMAFQAAAGTIVLGQAKSKEAPRVITRTYEELVTASAMSDERKRYWLGQE